MRELIVAHGIDGYHTGSRVVGGVVMFDALLSAFQHRYCDGKFESLRIMLRQPIRACVGEYLVGSGAAGAGDAVAIAPIINTPTSAAGSLLLR